MGAGCGGSRILDSRCRINQQLGSSNIRGTYQTSARYLSSFYLALSAIKTNQLTAQELDHI
jgi:hypothetical protein